MMGKLLASASWVSAFFLGWLMALGAIPSCPAGAIFVVFLLVGITSSVLLWGDRPKEGEE